MYHSSFPATLLSTSPKYQCSTPLSSYHGLMVFPTNDSLTSLDRLETASLLLNNLFGKVIHQIFYSTQLSIFKKGTGHSLFKITLSWYVPFAMYNALIMDLPLSSFVFQFFLLKTGTRCQFAKARYGFLMPFSETTWIHCREVSYIFNAM